MRKEVVRVRYTQQFVVSLRRIHRKHKYLSTAKSKSASSNTRAADFPPSSRVTLFRLLRVAASWTAFPPAMEPVKLILATSMCDANREPVSWAPVRNWTTPGGKPASTKSGARAREPRGDFSEGLKMT